MDEVKSVFSGGSSDLSRERKAVSHAKICGGKGIRTPGLLIANETLYQLSYTPNLPMETGSDKFAKKTVCPPPLHTCILLYGNNTAQKRRPAESWRISLPVFIEPGLLCPDQSGRQGNQTFLKNHRSYPSAAATCAVER